MANVVRQRIQKTGHKTILKYFVALSKMSDIGFNIQ